MPSASQPRTDRPRWLLRKPGDDAAARLFCFPYSGCGASMYHHWPRRIGPVEICLIQLPGRENRIREPHYGSYPDLADLLADALPPYLDRPFAFFGHCGGALPGVELTLRLAERRLPTPQRLFVSSQVAPHQGPYGRFLRLTDDELTTELETLVLAMGGRPHPSLLELSLALLRDDIEANKRYHVAAPVRLPAALTIIGWTRDTEIPMDLMRGWRDWSHQVDFTLLDGQHYEFLDAPPALLAVIERGMGTGPDATADAAARPGS